MIATGLGALLIAVSSFYQFMVTGDWFYLLMLFLGVCVAKGIYALHQLELEIERPKRDL